MADPKQFAKWWSFQTFSDEPGNVTRMLVMDEKAFRAAVEQIRSAKEKD